LAFGLGTVYEFVQAYITYKMHPEVNGKYIFYVRITIAVASILILIGGKGLVEINRITVCKI